MPQCLAPTPSSLAFLHCLASSSLSSSELQSNLASLLSALGTSPAASQANQPIAEALVALISVISSPVRSSPLLTYY